MTTKKPDRHKSRAVKLLEDLAGGPLTLGGLLNAIRLGDELTQATFAKRLAVSKAHLCDIEKDRRIVSPARAFRWAKKLGYSTQQFVELALEAALKKEGLKFHVKLTAA